MKKRNIVLDSQIKKIEQHFKQNDLALCNKKERSALGTLR
jgi:hypothetical protein